MELPVFSLREDIVTAVKNTGRLLLRAPTGSGKSTCVPTMLLDGGVDGLIVVVQPRRIAARLLARHVASLRGDSLEVGHVVRFENTMGKQTRIVYVTDGVLQRWLQEDGSLPGVGAVVFDEFHERRIASDVALARCLDLQDGLRKDLKVVVMSATLETGGLREYLNPCDVLEADGRMFPVEIKHQAVSPPSSRGGNRTGIWDHVAGAIAQEVSRENVGHILVFLPGVYEIRRTVELVERSTWSRGWKVCPLYSGLAPKLQDEAVAAKGSPRIIISTNVAETSLTIDGVRTVIDAGQARVARYDAERGIDTLMVEKISRASADQRAGRAGRTAPGKCLRLWSENDHGSRDAFELPEIKRVDLAEVLLGLKAAGVDDVAGFRWLESPEEAALAVAHELLRQLGALDELGEITGQGRIMARFPLHPRYARLLLAGQDNSCLGAAVFIAAAVQSEGVFARGKGGLQQFSEETDTTDFAAEWRAFKFARDMSYDVRRCGDYGIMARGARELGKSLQQLEGLAQRAGLEFSESDDFDQSAVSAAVLAALSDRLAVQMGEATLSCRVVGNRKGKMDTDSVAKGAEVFIAAEITEVGGREVSVYLNRCTQIKSEALAKQFPDEFRDVDTAVYDEASRRVIRKRETLFRDLTIHSKEGGEPPLADAARLLSERVVSGELKLNEWDRTIEQWIARLVNLTEWMPEMELPGFSNDDQQMVVEEICQGAKSYKEIKNRKVLPVISRWLSEPQKAVLDAYAPTEVKLSNGKTTKVRYKVGAEPWIAMKMQHLYDVEELPKIAEGKVGLLVHLLAPNQRPWQVTGDLKGFWERGYPQMKKDLAGRYPKHEWR